MSFKVKYYLRGIHYYCILYVAASKGTHIQCGTFIIREDELKSLKQAMPGIVFELTTV